MKIDFIADTNFLIYVHEGQPVVEQFLAYDFGISFISEVELLGYKGISKTDETKLNAFSVNALRLNGIPVSKLPFFSDVRTTLDFPMLLSQQLLSSMKHRW